MKGSEAGFGIRTLESCQTLETPNDAGSATGVDDDDDDETDGGDDDNHAHADDADHYCGSRFRNCDDSKNDQADDYADDEDIGEDDTDGDEADYINGQH